MSSNLDEFKKPIDEWARRAHRRETEGESFDSLQAAVRARLPDRRNRFRDRSAVRSGYQKGVILMKVTNVRVLTRTRVTCWLMQILPSTTVFLW